MSASANKLQQYAAGRELLELLTTSVKARDVADRITSVAARLAVEARNPAAGQGLQAGASLGCCIPAH